MSMERRHTQEVGSNQGEHFNASHSNAVIVRLTSFTISQQLSGIEIRFSNRSVESIGDTTIGTQSSLSGVDADPVSMVNVYLNTNETEVVGLRFTQKSGTSSMHGKETSEFRSIAFPSDCRLHGISGQAGTVRVFSIKFTYESTRVAFEPRRMLDEQTAQQHHHQQQPAVVVQDQNNAQDYWWKGALIVGAVVTTVTLGPIFRRWTFGW